MGSKFYSLAVAIVGALLCLSLASTSAQAAFISATPSSNTVGIGDPSFTVEFFMHFGEFEAPQAMQFVLELIDDDPVADPTTFPVPGPPGVVLTTPLAGWNIPASSLNAFIPVCTGPPGCSTPSPAFPANYFAAGADLFGPKPSGLTLSLGVLTFSADAAGTMDVELVLDTASSFWSPDGIAQLAFDDVGTIASFSVGAVPEAPLALLLGPALFAAAFLRRNRVRAS